MYSSHQGWADSRVLGTNFLFENKNFIISLSLSQCVKHGEISPLSPSMLEEKNGLDASCLKETNKQKVYLQYLALLFLLQWRGTTFAHMYLSWRAEK